MNTIEDEEESQTGNLVQRRRRKSVRQHQAANPEETALSMANMVLQATNADEAEAVPKRKHQGLTGQDATEANEAEVVQKRRRRSPTGQDVGRNRGSPARLYKLNQGLSPAQIDLIKSKDFGGLLNIARNLPSEMTKWVMGTYATATRELVIPEKGTIAVTAESVHRNFNLPMRGKKVIYERTQDSVDFIAKEYGIEGGKSPLITDWCKMIKDMKGKADDKFLRAYLIAAMSCLLCPTTSLHVSPRCYPNFINLDDVVNINFCEFVADQIHEASLKLGDKSSVKCCVYHLLILYLDSLDIDEAVSNCPVRAEAWTTELINKVVQLDTKADGGYGKLDHKPHSGAPIDTAAANDDSLFKGLAHAENFVSSKLPDTYNPSKKRKIAMMVGDLCTDISQKLGKFVEAIGELHDEDVKETTDEAPKKKQKRKPAAARDDKKKGGNEVVKQARQKDDQDGQDANVASKASDKQIMKEGGEATVEEEVDEEKDQEEEEDGDEVAGDHHRGADRGDDGDGGQGGQASSKHASQTDSPILDKWLRNSSKTKGGNTASPSKGIPRLQKLEETSPTGQVAEPKKETINSIVADPLSKANQPHQQQLCSETQDTQKLNNPTAGEQQSTGADQNLLSAMDKAAVNKTKVLADRDASAKAVKVARKYNQKYKKIAFRRNLTLPTSTATEEIPTCANQGIKGTATQPAANKVSQATEAISVKEGTQKIEAAKLGGQGVEKVQTHQGTVKELPARGEKRAGTCSFYFKRQVSAKATICLVDQATPAQDRIKGEGNKCATDTAAAAQVVTPQGLPGHQPRQPSSICATLAPLPTTTATSCAPQNSVGTAPLEHVRGSSVPVHPIEKSRSRVVFNGLDFEAPSFDLGFDSTPAPPLFDRTPAPPMFDSTPAPPLFDRTPAPPMFDRTPAPPLFDRTPAPPLHVVGPDISPEGTAAGNIRPNVANPAITAQGHELPDEEWDDATIAELCVIVDDLVREGGMAAVKIDNQAIVDLSTPPESNSGASIKQKSTSAIIDLCTPPPPAMTTRGKENFGSVSAKSSSGSAPKQGPERRAIKPTACKRAPYVDIDSKATYQCSNDVKQVYAAVLAFGGRRTTRAKESEKSDDIIKYNNFFVTVSELASSMAPTCRLSNSVVEIGIEYIMQKQPSSVKKCVMPLRIGTKLINMDWSGNEIKKNFDRDNSHLDRMDMVMFPVLETLDPKHPQESNHYWLFNLNIRDRRYEIFDSIRSFSNQKLNEAAKRIATCIIALWGTHYSKSRVKVDQFKWLDVGGPKQDNTYDCGVFTLMNAELWDGRNTLDYAQPKIPNIRKLLTYAWLSSEENEIDWKPVLKLK